MKTGLSLLLEVKKKPCSNPGIIESVLGMLPSCIPTNSKNVFIAKNDYILLSIAFVLKIAILLAVTEYKKTRNE